MNFQVRLEAIAKSSGFWGPEMAKPAFTISFFIVLLLATIFACLLTYPVRLFKCEALAQEVPYYIGNRKCRLCHFEYFKEWEQDPHANAFAQLGRMKNNPYCLKCHTTGYGEAQGFVSEKITPQLRGVQCEACHGPGSTHKDNPHDKGSLPIGRKIDYQGVCIKCHDRNWTPEFNYEKYRRRIEHRVKPEAEKVRSSR